MSPGQLRDHPAGGRFPRVSGDEPGTLASEIRRLVFSPRERG